MRTFRLPSLDKLERCMEDLEVADSLMDYEEDVDSFEITIYDDPDVDCDFEDIVGQHGGHEITDASR